jgi:hypothetical protein
MEKFTNSKVAHGRIPEKLQGKQLPEDVETAVAAILSQ